AQDDVNASRLRREAEESAKTTQPTQAGALPLKVMHYLAIRRVWFNHKINPMIDRSVSTVKADAAHRAFLAEGKDIVWAIIDSGIDGTHIHFKEKKTLEVTLPVQHCDFTVGGEPAGAPSALEDAFGHGTHVAGIVAGAYVSDTPAKAKRSKLGPDGGPEA